MIIVYFADFNLIFINLYGPLDIPPLTPKGVHAAYTLKQIINSARPELCDKELVSDISPSKNLNVYLIKQPPVSQLVDLRELCLLSAM